MKILIIIIIVIIIIFIVSISTVRRPQSGITFLSPRLLTSHPAISLVAILRCILFLERRWRFIAVSIRGLFVLNGHSLSMLNGPPLDISTTWMMYCDKGTPVKSVIIYYRFINFSASGKHSECRWSRMASYSNPPFVIRQTCMNFN